MRGPREPQSNMLLGVTPEDLVPARHPIRRIRAIADAALSELSATVTAMYATTGRHSVPPEPLLKGTLLMGAVLAAQRAAVLRAPAIRPARRTGSACSSTPWRSSSWRQSPKKRSAASSSQTTTSPSTGRCCRPEPH